MRRVPSKLDPAVQELTRIIFDTKAMENTLLEFDIDLKKLPLGKISKNIILVAMDTLHQIEAALKNDSQAALRDLTNRFYTVIPRNFGLGTRCCITPRGDLFALTVSTSDSNLKSVIRYSEDA